MRSEIRDCITHSEGASKKGRRREQGVTGAVPRVDEGASHLEDAKEEAANRQKVVKSEATRQRLTVGEAIRRSVHGLVLEADATNDAGFLERYPSLLAGLEHLPGLGGSDFLDAVAAGC